jgi:hypothetical protein
MITVMHTKTILWWLLLCFGEALLVAAFFLFRGDMPDSILVLNIAVSSVVYWLFAGVFGVPWIDTAERSQRQTGSMGIQWWIAGLYSVAAVAVMLLANAVFRWTFGTQFLVQATGGFLLLGGLLAASHVSAKVHGMYQAETTERNGILEMKKAMRRLTDQTGETTDLPDTFLRRIHALDDGLRFISPSGSSEAHALESEFIDTVNAIGFALRDYVLNERQIESAVGKCERLYRHRKQICSD